MSGEEASNGSLLSANEVIGGAGLGFHTIFDFTKSDLEYPYNVLYVRKQFGAERRKAVLGLLRGLGKTAMVYAGQSRRSGKDRSALAQKFRHGSSTTDNGNTLPFSFTKKYPIRRKLDSDWL